MSISDIFQALGPHPIAGGCPDCDSETRFVTHAPGVYVMEIHHDDTCPDYIARRARGAAS
ncbi:hypothetical protein [Dietzia sp. 111N12-1]|uniref:hypothetical protein n=1 Tax=Dietzia sp. 111N12-1 TaxID=1785156 RepID=UPI0008055A1D|nr:hypothetical protein [Dietzia sp. 111N12-1]OAV78096.1 hypothetical protein AYO52_13615 [Dietzia sp. 111N12-1]